jgi:Holliday junction resolvase
MLLSEALKPHAGAQGGLIMTTQPESRLSGKIQKELRAHGVFCFKVHGGAMMMAGLPDIIACVNGLFVGLEVKMPDERDNVTVRQHYVHSEIRKSHGLVYVVCSTKEAMRAIRQASQMIPKRAAN